MTTTTFIFIGLTIAANLTIFLVSYLRFKQAAKQARQARFNSILPTAQTLTAKQQKAVFDKYKSLIFGAFGLAFNEASAKDKGETDAEQIMDLLFCADVCYFVAKDGLTLRQFIGNVVGYVAYCLPLWSFDKKLVNHITDLICDQLDFILTFD